MPRNLAQYTHCAAPGDAHPIDAGSIALMAFWGLVGGALLAGIYAITAALLGAAAGAGCIIGVALITTAMIGCIEFKDWYYNARLMCIQHDQCACGTIVGDPHSSFDGDRKVEILIAPFAVAETEQLLRETVIAMGAAAELSGVPAAADLQDRDVLRNYVRGLSQAQQNLLYVRLVDARMFNQPGRAFLRHLHRRDSAIMGAAAFSNSPSDTGSSPNPMFRVNAQEGDDPEERVLVPYMHCEIEGHSMAIFLDNLLLAIIAMLVSFTAVCAVCMYFTAGAGVWACAAIAAVASAILAFLVWLLANWLNSPDDGEASEIDVEVADPDYDTPPTAAQQGDVVYMFGDWIMDEEHSKYFEIHPIKAYYLLCRSPASPDDWQLTDEVPASDCEFDVTQLTEADFKQICEIVQTTEKRDPDGTLTVSIPHALAKKPPKGQGQGQGHGQGQGQGQGHGHR